MIKKIKEGFVSKVDDVYLIGYTDQVRIAKATVFWSVYMEIHSDGIFNLNREVSKIEVYYKDFDDDFTWQKLDITGFEILKIQETKGIELPITVNSIDIKFEEKTILIR